MSKLQRIIQQEIYYAKRKNHFKTQKRGGVYSNTLDIKKLLGIICILLGVLLLFSRCSIGKKSKQAINAPTTVEKNKSAWQVNAIVNQAQVELQEELVEEVLEEAAADDLDNYRDFLCNTSLSAQDLQHWLQYSYKKKEKSAYILSVAAYEKQTTASNKDIEQLFVNNKVAYTENNYIHEGESFFKQFIYDVKKFPLIPQKGVHYEPILTDNGKQQTVAILPSEGKIGTTKVVSMTDGQIEKVLWSQKKGYEVGIRSNGGAYFSYSCLLSNPTHLKEGSKIKAGDPIGSINQYVELGIAVMLSDEQYWIAPTELLLYLEKYI